MAEKFIADVHLGKLARLLRLLGFDTFYENNVTINDLLRLSTDQDRIILSRNKLFSKKSNKSFLVIDENPSIQLKQLYDHFHLKDQIHPFSRCIVCNGTLEAVSKEDISVLLEKNTSQYFNEFWQCKHCKRIYWKGTHYENMLKKIQNITGGPV